MATAAVDIKKLKKGDAVTYESRIYASKGTITSVNRKSLRGVRVTIKDDNHPKGEVTIHASHIKSVRS